MAVLDFSQHLNHFLFFIYSQYDVQLYQHEHRGHWYAIH